MSTTAAQQAREAGLPGLAYITEQTGVGRSTLDLWHKQKPDLFRVVVAGCAAMAKEGLDEREHQRIQREGYEAIREDRYP